MNDIQCFSFISVLSIVAVTGCPGGYDFLYNKAAVLGAAIPRKAVNISTRSCVISRDDAWPRFLMIPKLHVYNF
jgi:hypothetical protein